MKNLFLSALLVLTVSFAFANNNVEKFSTVNDITIELTNSVEIADANFGIEIDVEYTSFEEIDAAAGPCRWRTCTYRDGVLIGCTGWTYGYCLDEVVLK